MSLDADEMRKHIDWLLHRDVREFLTCDTIQTPWFPALESSKNDANQIRWFSALVPPDAVPRLVEKQGGWDVGPVDGHPSVWTYYSDGKRTRRYFPFGNEDGIEPLVMWRSFHGMRQDFIELAQEFRLYFNLIREPARKVFIHIDDNGDETEAARYGDNFIEIRTDLLKRFCAVKQMALAVYVESFRYSRFTLAELGLSEDRKEEVGRFYRFPLSVVSKNFSFDNNQESCGLLIGGKKYVLPGPMPPDEEPHNDVFQDFIIGSDANSNAVRHTCDPERLENSFGANRGSPHYLTAVFFRSEVLSKYYADPAKYSVEDGYLRCGGLWGLRMDNDHSDYVVVWLGDLGRDLSEVERNYWLSFNILPAGRKISRTNFQRALLGEFADPSRPDLIFKHEYARFNRTFRETNGWDFFLPLHHDDEHFFTALRLPTNNSQAEFDSQLLALTKVIVDSFNEHGITGQLKTTAKGDHGITKLEKFLEEKNLEGFESHIKYLRILQELRSKSAAHRKGSNYDKLLQDLQMADKGQQSVFAALLVAAIQFLSYLQANLIPKRDK